MKKECQMCFHWKSNRDQEELDIGECRYNPPVVFYLDHKYSRTLFPRIAGDEWCSKFEFDHDKIVLGEERAMGVPK